MSGFDFWPKLTPSAELPRRAWRYRSTAARPLSVGAPWELPSIAHLNCDDLAGLHIRKVVPAVVGIVMYQECRAHSATSW